jgi:hypothetical protein
MNLFFSLFFFYFILRSSSSSSLASLVSFSHLHHSRLSSRGLLVDTGRWRRGGAFGMPGQGAFGLIGDFFFYVYFGGGFRWDRVLCLDWVFCLSLMVDWWWCGGFRHGRGWSLWVVWFWRVETRGGCVRLERRIIARLWAGCGGESTDLRCANLEVERTVDMVQPVLLGAEDRSPIIASAGSACDARRQLLWVVALMIRWLGLVGSCCEWRNGREREREREDVGREREREGRVFFIKQLKGKWAVLPITNVNRKL